MGSLRRRTLEAALVSGIRGTFSLSIEIGRSGSPMTHTLELVRAGRKVLFHRARIQSTS
jgi:hypothetical protein